MNKKRNKWQLILALIWMSISVMSLFVGIISYSEGSYYQGYALPELLDGDRFSREVLSRYTGEFFVEIDNIVLVLLCVLAVVSIVMAFAGLMLLSKQRPVRWPYIMTLIGMIGTLIPSILIYVVVFMSRTYFPGEFSFGIYPVITPIAVLLCFIIVLRERKRILKSIQLEKSVADLIRPAGDL